MNDVRRSAAKMAAVELECLLANAAAAGLTVTVHASGTIYLWDTDDWDPDTDFLKSMTTAALARLERRNGVWDATWDRS